MQDVMTTTEVCERLGVTRSTVSRWSSPQLQPKHRRLTPVFKMPGPRGPFLFRRRDVERLAEELERERYHRDVEQKAAEFEREAGS